MFKSHQKQSRQILLISLFFFQSAVVHAEQCLVPLQLTKQLYQKYFFSRNVDRPTFSSTTKSNLEKYLTKSLAFKIDQDNKCQERTQMICNLEFEILTDSQDSPENAHYKITQTAPNLIEVIILGTDYKEKIQLKFSQENQCMKISNILYSNHSSLKQILK